MPSTHNAPGPRLPHRGIVSIICLVFGALFLLLYVALDHSESHSFNVGATPPSSVQVTAGRTYEISTPGGVAGLVHRDVNPSGITCTYAQSGSADQKLTISTLGANSRTTHAVATFIAPVSGELQIKCPDLIKGVFVDDADNGAADPAGLFLLLATIAFALAVPTGLSYLYRRSTERSAARVSVSAESGDGDGIPLPPDVQA